LASAQFPAREQIPRHVFRLGRADAPLHRHFVPIQAEIDGILAPVMNPRPPST